jgi:hypothetical protein
MKAKKNIVLASRPFNATAIPPSHRCAAIDAAHSGAPVRDQESLDIAACASQSVDEIYAVFIQLP